MIGRANVPLVVEPWSIISDSALGGLVGQTIPLLFMGSPVGSSTVTMAWFEEGTPMIEVEFEITTEDE